MSSSHCGSRRIQFNHATAGQRVKESAVAYVVVRGDDQGGVMSTIIGVVSVVMLLFAIVIASRERDDRDNRA